MKKQIATLCALVSMVAPASSEALLDCAGYTGPCEVVSVSRPWSSRNIYDYEGSTRITVEQGQTLIGIAEQYLGDRKAYLRIAKKNGIEAPYKIYAGQKLRLP